MDDSLIEGSPGAVAVNTSASPALNVSWLSACGHPYLCPEVHVGSSNISLSSGPIEGTCCSRRHEAFCLLLPGEQFYRANNTHLTGLFYY